MRPFERSIMITKLYRHVLAAFVGDWSILAAEVFQGQVSAHGSCQDCESEAHMVAVAFSVPRVDDLNYFSCADHTDRFTCTSLLSHLTHVGHVGRLACVNCLAYCTADGLAPSGR